MASGAGLRPGAGCLISITAYGRAGFGVFGDRWYCKEKSIDWFVSCWDEVAVDFMEQFNPGVYKLLCFADRPCPDRKGKADGQTLYPFYRMSTMDEIRKPWISLYGQPDDRAFTSAYPCPPQELNLRMIETLG